MSSFEAHTAYDVSTPQTAHTGLAAAMFAECMPYSAVVLNVGAGNTDLAADMAQYGRNLDVISLDPKESTVPANQVRSVAQRIPLRSESVDVTLCQFGIQHFSNVAGAAIEEMIRVTKVADSERDGTKGFLLLNPVFRPAKLEHLLEREGLDDVAGLLYHDQKNFPLRDRSTMGPTLYVHKTPTLTQARAHELAELVAGSKAMKPYWRRVGELAARARGGRSNR